jgi:hypothetical protein
VGDATLVEDELAAKVEAEPLVRVEELMELDAAELVIIITTAVTVVVAVLLEEVEKGEDEKEEELNGARVLARRIVCIDWVHQVV